MSRSKGTKTFILIQVPPAQKIAGVSATFTSEPTKVEVIEALDITQAEGRAISRSFEWDSSVMIAQFKRTVPKGGRYA